MPNGDAGDALAWSAHDSCTARQHRWIEERGREMTDMIVVEDRNQDDMSRKAGCYLYADTRLWLEDNLVHRGDGPAVISPDGVERWYVRGKDVTRDVNTFFFRNKWPAQRGLDTAEKMASFRVQFLK
jgi:hypothetical protein